MAKKYSKYTSNFILSEKYQNTEKGLISLRDWTTIGEIERLEKGKKPLYGNGNFLFTTRNVVTNPTRHTVSKFIGSYFYDDVKDAKPQNNLTELNLYTNDLRDFAYYGSTSELVQATIQHIIQTFPARITISEEKILNIECFKDDDGVELINENVVKEDIQNIDVFEYKKDSSDKPYLINNPFGVDLHHEDIILDEYSKPYRYLTYDFKNFEVSSDGKTFKPIESYSVTIDYNEINKTQEYSLSRFNCIFNHCKVAEIKINEDIKINGYLFDNELKWGYENETLFIQPKQEVIDEYFNELQGLEKLLLRRDTKPLYYCRLATPVITNDIMQIVDRGYYFPHKDGFIDITSNQFVSYINHLYDIANIWDETYTDNLYQRMTHESIKNYDWTFTKDYNNGDEEEFIDGGVRIEKLLHIYGRLFDDIKHHIDGIKYNVNNTYDGYRNMPTAQLSDSLENHGWHVLSTIPLLEVIKDENNQEASIKEFNNQVITDDFLIKKNIKWFDNRNNNYFDYTQCNTNFLKRLLMNSSYILRSKGTIKCIEMMFGLFGLGIDSGDFIIHECYYETNPKKFDKEIEKTFNKIIDSFENIVTETNPRESFPVALKKFIDEPNDGETMSSLASINDASKVTKSSYLIPFLNMKTIADANLYFQSNGGWVKYSETSDKKQNYLETISYLHVKYDLNELFNIVPLDVKEGDIFYVINVNDYKYLFGTDKEPNSHYFYINNKSQIYNAKGWENINLNNDSNTQESIKESKHEKIKQQIEHLENIVVTNIGNNPHVGYGRYDAGQYYIDNMKNPFSYAKDNFYTSYGDSEIYISEEKRNEDIEKFNFTIKEHFIKHSNKYYNNEDKFDDTVNDNNTPQEEIKEKIFIINKNEEYETYYLNSKVLKIINKHNNMYYKEYFKEVILPYILQVIPSTTILILQDF